MKTGPEQSKFDFHGGSIGIDQILSPPFERSLFEYSPGPIWSIGGLIGSYQLPGPAAFLHTGFRSLNAMRAGHGPSAGHSLLTLTDLVDVMGSPGACPTVQQPMSDS